MGFINIGVEMSDYPECEKLQAVSEKSQELGFFLEWLKNKYTLCEFVEEHKEFFGDNKEDYVWINEGYYQSRDSIENILAEYFDIDMNKVDEERAQILEDIRKNSK